MAVIQANTGEKILVDDCDFETLSGSTWTVMNTGYVIRKVLIGKERYDVQQLHRVIMGLPKSSVVLVDHINGNRLDNRRENLRLCTKSQNGCNRGVQANSKSGIKGVIFEKRRNYWQAVIELHGKRHYLGSFQTSDEAAHAYNKAAIALHGEFAALNPVGSK